VGEEMEVARKLLVVYYNHQHVVKKLEKHGHLIYSSNKLKYAYIYIDAKDLKMSFNNIKHIKGVLKVEESLTDMSEFNFSF
jgi:uncharacterized protein YlbG (UPF0298 family)